MDSSVNVCFWRWAIKYNLLEDHAPFDERASEIIISNDNSLNPLYLRVNCDEHLKCFSLLKLLQTEVILKRKIYSESNKFCLQVRNKKQIRGSS